MRAFRHLPPRPSDSDREPRPFAPGEHEAGVARRKRREAISTIKEAIGFVLVATVVGAGAVQSCTGNNGDEHMAPVPVVSDPYRRAPNDAENDDVVPVMLYDVPMEDAPDAGVAAVETNEIPLKAIKCAIEGACRIW